MPYILDYVLPKKAEELKRISEQFVEIDSCNIISCPSAYILPVDNIEGGDLADGKGGVISKDFEFITESALRERPGGFYDFDVDKCKFFDKKVVFCGYFHRAWGHFLTEVVSRLWYVIKNDETIDNYVFIVEKDSNISLKSNYLEFMKLLGIEDKVILIDTPMQFAEVVIPEPGFDYHSHYTTEFRRMYNYLSTKAVQLYNGPTYEKIYFSKSKLSSSITSNLNYQVIDKYFVKNGFKIFYPEQLNLIDMIGLIQGCKEFASISSSLAHNFLFGRPDQTCISIEKQAFYNPYQIFVTNIVGCKSVYIDASRTLLPVGAFGPFIFDYTDSLSRYTEDHNMIPLKPMSFCKYKRVCRTFFDYYFNAYRTMPPNYMYSSRVLELEREAYEETLNSSKVFRLPIYQRILIKIKRFILKLKNKL